MPETAPPAPEPRWPPILTLVLLLALITGLPDHLRLLPSWAPWVVSAVVLLPMCAVGLGARGPWPAIERVAAWGAATVLVAGTLALLVLLIRHIVGGSPLSGLELLGSSVIVWVCNIVGFALLFWQLDGGGPDARARAPGWPDWLFPQATAEGAVPPGWRPGFVDYLYLAFATATAFSTTDVTPLTARAKLVMMLEAAMSLATLAVVASRAINVLAG